MRHVVQPGSAPAERIVWAEARGRRVSFTLQAGRKLLDVVGEAFAAEGFASGVLTLDGGALSPLAYVIPALSPTERHAAFYSGTFRPDGACRLHAGALTFGSRDGAPFFHCHALWREADGHLRGGHILPDETVVAETIQAQGVGLRGAIFSAQDDPETNFKLFEPASEPGPPPSGDSRLFVLRLRPNQDVSLALETFCREGGLGNADLYGGVGSIIGAQFTDGRSVEPFATEMAIRSGRIVQDAGANLAEIDAVLVDLTGTPSEGWLMRGSNPILMTLEVVVGEAS